MEKNKNETIKLELTKDESIVLFEFLIRINEKENNIIFEDQSEQRLLWNIEAILEKLLIEPFQMNYDDIVKQARNNIRDKTE